MRSCAGELLEFVCSDSAALGDWPSPGFLIFALMKSYPVIQIHLGLTRDLSRMILPDDDLLQTLLITQ
jgi:hypothetical protein